MMSYDQFRSAFLSVPDINYNEKMLDIAWTFYQSGYKAGNNDKKREIRKLLNIEV